MLVAGVASGGMLLDSAGEFGPEPTSRTQAVSFDVPAGAEAIALDIEAKLSQGKVAMRLFDPSGKTAREHSTGGSMSVQADVVDTSGRSGSYRIEVVPQSAVGTWSVRAYRLPRRSGTLLYLFPGAAMALVALLAAALWRRWSGGRWRWLWAGAAVWTVGVALKVGWAVALNGPVLGALKRGAPEAVYLAAGSVYIGALTGVFEIGVTLVAGLVWRQMAKDAERAVGVGVGAGAFEAFVLGLAACVGAVYAFSGAEGSAKLLAQSTRATAATPLFWLVGPVERVLAILCHTASRALVLLAIARRRWVYFLWGFLLMTGLDAIAGWAHLSGQLGRISLWWIELAIAPFAVVSIPLIRWCIRGWPSPPSEPPPTPRPDFLPGASRSARPNPPVPCRPPRTAGKPPWMS
jgi:uncharacterized membrane protein YhfC